MLLQEEAAACEPLRQQVRLLEEQLDDARDDLGRARQQVDTLADTVDEASNAILVSSASRIADFSCWAASNSNGPSNLSLSQGSVS